MADAWTGVAVSEVEDRPYLEADLPFLDHMVLIRRTEEKLLDLFGRGLLTGTTHTSIGQESCSTGVLAAIDRERDIIFSNHRCHGHFLAYGGPLDMLFGELMGKGTGASAGIGGSQQLHYRNFYSSGILGGTIAAATGMALAEKLKDSGALVTAFMGDGAFGEGIVYESMNIASLWGLPILYVVEANGWAQSTPTRLEHAGRLADRPRAFGIATRQIDADGPAIVNMAAHEMMSAVRQGHPGCLILNTYRLSPHSKGDDDRPLDERERAAATDPLNRLLEAAPIAAVTSAESQAKAAILESLDRALCADVLSYQAFQERVAPAP
jgi:TPP-dependent pyruvate/acetoin dehydrogenase alpha subunit